VRDAPLWRLIRSESRSALTDGLVAAVAVLAVGLVAGAATWPVAVGAVAAVPLGFVLHQAVLVVGVLLVRLRGTHTSGRAGYS